MGHEEHSLADHPCVEGLARGCISFPRKRPEDEVTEYFVDLTRGHELLCLELESQDTICVVVLQGYITLRACGFKVKYSGKYKRH